VCSSVSPLVLCTVKCQCQKNVNPLWVQSTPIYQLINLVSSFRLTCQQSMYKGNEMSVNISKDVARQTVAFDDTIHCHYQQLWFLQFFQLTLPDQLCTNCNRGNTRSSGNNFQCAVTWWNHYIGVDTSQTDRQTAFSIPMIHSQMFQQLHWI